MDSLNHALLIMINVASISLASMAQSFARDLIFIVPLIMVVMWFRGSERQFVINTLVALVVAIIIALVVRVFLSNISVGSPLSPQQKTSSCPSLTGTLIFTFTMAFWLWQRVWAALLLSLIALLIGWANIYLGVHKPEDMVMALIIMVVSCIASQCIWHVFGRSILNYSEQIYRCIFSSLIAKGWVRG